jgi:hypothetical protein
MGAGRENFNSCDVGLRERKPTRASALITPVILLLRNFLGRKSLTIGRLPADTADDPEVTAE